MLVSVEAYVVDVLLIPIVRMNCSIAFVVGAFMSKMAWRARTSPMGTSPWPQLPKLLGRLEMGQPSGWLNDGLFPNLAGVQGTNGFSEMHRSGKWPSACTSSLRAAPRNPRPRPDSEVAQGRKQKKEAKGHGKPGKQMGFGTLLPVPLKQTPRGSAKQGPTKKEPYAHWEIRGCSLVYGKSESLWIPEKPPAKSTCRPTQARVSC